MLEEGESQHRAGQARQQPFFNSEEQKGDQRNAERELRELPGFKVASVFFAGQAAQQLASVLVAQSLDHFGSFGRRGVEHGIDSVKIAGCDECEKEAAEKQSTQEKCGDSGVVHVPV